MKMYKDGAECTVDRHQVEIMEKAGWSKQAPKAAETKDEGESGPAETGDTPAPRRGRRS